MAKIVDFYDTLKSFEYEIYDVSPLDNKTDCTGPLTLEEFGKEIPEPKRPHYLMLLRQIHDIPKEWEHFLLF